MLKADVVSHFSKKSTHPIQDIAEFCGISKPAVSQWGKYVPELHAIKLQRHTRGKLRIVKGAYDRKANGHYDQRRRHSGGGREARS